MPEHIFKKSIGTRLRFLVLATVISGSLSVQSAPNETAEAKTRTLETKGPPMGWGVALSGGYLHQFDTDIDNGGSFSKNSAIIQAGVRHTFTPDRSAALSIGYGYDDYDFSGSPGFGGANPWSELHTLRFGAPVIWGVGESWKVFIIPTVRLQGETGAPFGDSLSGGGLVGFSYMVNDRFTIGPGFGAITQLEDTPTYFPVLIIDWRISEKWNLSTGRGLGATLGPGLTLGWKPLDRWRFGIGARYEKMRFRLNDNNSVAPNGVGEDRSQPVFLSAEYAPGPEMSVSVIGGAQMGGELKLADQNGNQLAQTDYKTGAFVGMTFNLRF
jgi:hypothetical protein